MLILLAGVCYGILSTIVKLAYQHHFSPADVTSSQILLGCLGLWTMSMASLKQLRACSWTTVLKLMGSGISYGLTGVFYYVALQTLSVALGVIVFFQYVWMGILLEWIFQRRAPTRNRWLALLLVGMGTILAAGYQAWQLAHLNLVGICFGLLAALCYAVILSVSGRVAVEVPPLLKSALMVTGGTITTLVIFPPVFLVNGSLGQGLWVWGLLLGLFGVILPSFLLNKGTPIIGVGLATILSAIELPMVIAVSALVLGETIDVLQWGGVVLILLGIVVAEQSAGLRKSVCDACRSAG